MQQNEPMLQVIMQFIYAVSKARKWTMESWIEFCYVKYENGDVKNSTLVLPLQQQPTLPPMRQSAKRSPSNQPSFPSNRGKVRASKRAHPR